MGARRVDPNRIKLHYSYTAVELAVRLGVHKNTLRHWQKQGLQPVDDSRPALFHGAQIRSFLIKRNARRKRPCPPGTLYCFRCRAARPPALGMVDYVSINAVSGNIRAICGTCETVMHRRTRKALLSVTMPGCDVQFAQAPARLIGRPLPSLNCDLERQATT